MSPRGPDLKPRKLRPAPVRDGLVPSRAVPKRIRRARWAAKMLAGGRCVSCGRDRDHGGEKGTTRLCRRCAKRHAKRQRKKAKP